MFLGGRDIPVQTSEDSHGKICKEKCWTVNYSKSICSQARSIIQILAQYSTYLHRNVIEDSITLHKTRALARIGKVAHWKW